MSERTVSNVSAGFSIPGIIYYQMMADMIGRSEITCILQESKKDEEDTTKSLNGDQRKLDASEAEAVDSEYEPIPKKNYEPAGIIAPHGSPKKRLNIPNPKRDNVGKDKTLYKYGNYSRYYGYRNTKDFHDVRLNVFAQHKDLFVGMEILDIGCNVGLLTMSIAKEYSISHITGLDIDKSLINQAKKFIQRQRRNFTGIERSGYPFNVTFLHGNYVVRNAVLLEVKERQHFDLILCLSVTKWIHLNFGDDGVKLAFKRMFKQLKTGGKLILEPQPWNSYKRRKKLTVNIHFHMHKLWII